MLIERIELFLVELDLPADPAADSEESSAPPTCSVLARISSGGAAGWGEAVLEAWPRRRCEWAGGAFALLEQGLAPLLAGRRVDSAAALCERLSLRRGNPAAKAALDGAWWSLRAAQENVSLFSLLWKERRLPPVETLPEISVTVDFAAGRSADDAGPLLEGVRAACAAGFAQVKLQVRPGWDVSMLRAVRSEHPSQNIQLDCGGRFRLQDHLEMFCRLDDFFLTAIEEPFSAGLWEHARLQETISTAVGLGESLAGPEDLDAAAESGACRVVRLDPARLGGVSAALAAAGAARDAGLGAWIGGGGGVGVASEAAAALAAAPGFAFPADLLPAEGADARFRPPLAPFRGAAGVQVVRPWNELGEAVDVERIRSAAQASAEIRAARG